MRTGVLSDEYILEHCKEFRPFPLDKAPKLLKVNLPLNPLSGIKPIYNQTVVRPATIHNMVSSIDMISQKVGDQDAVYSRVMPKVISDFTAPPPVAVPATPPATPPASPPVSPRTGRGGARAGSGRMDRQEQMVKDIAKIELEFKEGIPKRMVREALREAGEGGALAAKDILKGAIRQESAENIMKVIMAKVEKQIERKEKGK